MNKMGFDELKLGGTGGICFADDALPGFTWQDIVDTVNANCEKINEQTVRNTINEMIAERTKNMGEVLEYGGNLLEIIRRAKA